MRVRHGRLHDREGLIRAFRVQVCGHALGEDHAVALHIEQLGEDVVCAVEQDVRLALVVVTPVQFHPRHEGALGARVRRPCEREHLVGVVVLDLHARIGVQHPIVGNIVHADGPAAGSEGEGAGCEVRLVHAEAVEVGIQNLLQPLILCGDLQLLVHEQVAPRLSCQRSRVQRLAVVLEQLEPSPRAVVVPLVVCGVPAPVFADGRSHAGVRVVP